MTEAIVAAIVAVVLPMDGGRYGIQAVPAPPPAENQPPMPIAEFRALDARLAPAEDEP